MCFTSPVHKLGMVIPSSSSGWCEIKLIHIQYSEQRLAQSRCSNSVRLLLLLSAFANNIIIGTRIQETSTVLVMFNCFFKKSKIRTINTKYKKACEKGKKKKKPLGVMPPVGEFQVRVHLGAAVESGSTAAAYFP